MKILLKQQSRAWRTWYQHTEKARLIQEKEEAILTLKEADEITMQQCLRRKEKEFEAKMNEVFLSSSSFLPFFSLLLFVFTIACRKSENFVLIECNQMQKNHESTLESLKKQTTSMFGNKMRDAIQEFQRQFREYSLMAQEDKHTTVDKHLTRVKREHVRDLELQLKTTREEHEQHLALVEKNFNQEIERMKRESENQIKVSPFWGGCFLFLSFLFYYWLLIVITSMLTLVFSFYCLLLILFLFLFFFYLKYFVGKKFLKIFNENLEKHEFDSIERMKVVTLNASIEMQAISRENAMMGAEDIRMRLVDVCSKFRKTNARAARSELRCEGLRRKLEVSQVIKSFFLSLLLSLLLFK